MSQVIGIVDYGYAGNIFNIRKTIESICGKTKTILIKTAGDLDGSDKIVLPGVGTYKDVMTHLSGIKDAMKEHIQKKPTLGICIGMHILSEKGYEYGETEGMKILDGEVMKMPVKGKVPHIGWAGVEMIKPSRIMKGVTAADSFYFMHSYELINYKDVTGLSNYCDHDFVCVSERDNVFGVQFHPEKSRESGIKVFKNFVDM